MNNVQCCFCGKRVSSDNRNPGEVIIVSNWDKPKGRQREQVFWTHIECVGEKMHETVRPYYFLDLLEHDDVDQA